MPPRSDFLAGLQSLRAIAALLVLAYHIEALCVGNGLPGRFFGHFFWFGRAGVDLFFVLSGFIICWRHAPDIGVPERVGAFARKRLVRVYPLSWALLFIAVPAHFVWPALGAGYERDPWVIVHSFFLIPMEHFPIVPQAWSLSHEMWFYLLFAIVIVLGRYAGLMFAGLVGVVSTIVTAYSLLHEGAFPVGFELGFLFSFYNLEFLFGCLCAGLIDRGSRGTPALYWTMLATAVVWFVSFGQFHDELERVWGEAHRVFSYGLPSAVIIYATVSLETVGRLTVPRGLRDLGDASYSLYLSHEFVVSLVVKGSLAIGLADAIGTQGVGMGAASAALAAGWGVYRYVEAPLLRFLRARFV